MLLEVVLLGGLGWLFFHILIPISCKKNEEVIVFFSYRFGVKRCPFFSLILFLFLRKKKGKEKGSSRFPSILVVGQELITKSHEAIGPSATSLSQRAV